MKKLLTIVLFAVVGMHLYAAGTKYYAIGKVVLSAEDKQTGMGKVYIIDNDRTAFPDNNGTDTQAQTESMQVSNQTVSVTLGAIEENKDYYIKEWISSEGATVPANASNAEGRSETKTNITATEGTPKTTTFTASFAKRIQIDPTMTINGDVSMSGQKTIKTVGTSLSCSPSATDKFTATVSTPQNGQSVLVVTATESAVDGDDVLITLTDNKGATAQILVSFVKQQKVFLKGSPLGTYKVSVMGGTPFIMNSSDEQEISITDPDNFTLTFTDMTPISSAYRFSSFKLTPTKESVAPYYVYDDDLNNTETTPIIKENTTIEPVFVAVEYAQFIVLDNPAVKYDDLNRAFKVAQEIAESNSAAKRVVAVYGTGGKLASGNYTIPAGFTFLVPGDNNNTYRTGDVNLGDFKDNATRSCKCHLEMDDNTTINAVGNISVYAKLSWTLGTNGTPITYGRISMGNNCHITVQSGAVLSVLGYITGSHESSSVTARPGATVYEAFQLADWRGGSATIGLAGVDLDIFGNLGSLIGGKDVEIKAEGNSGDIFPASQYYVQSIETKLVLEAGAVEKIVTAVDMSMATIEANAYFIVPDNLNVSNVSYSTGLFRLDSGTKLIKYYDNVEDRQYYKIEAATIGNKAYLDKIELVFRTEISGVGAKIFINSADFTVPITNNIDIDIENAYVYAKSPIAFLAGTKVHAFAGSKVFINSDVYVYDKEQNTGYFYTNDSELVPIPFTPDGSQKYKNDKGTSVNKRPSLYPLEDSKWIIDGELEIQNGALYTTYYQPGGNGKSTNVLDYGANITSNGNGKVYFGKKGSKNPMKTYQYSQVNSTNIEIPIINALLSNDTTIAVNKEKRYSAGDEAKQGETYYYYQAQGRWLIPELGIPVATNRHFQLTLPNDTTQWVECQVTEEGVTVTKIDVIVEGENFSKDTDPELGGEQYKNSILRVPVKYTARNKHNNDANNPYQGSITVTFTYNDPIKGNGLTKTETFLLTANEDYTPQFSVAIAGQSILDGGNYDLRGYLGIPNTFPVVITAADKNVAGLNDTERLTWPSEVGAPFQIVHSATPLNATLGYTPQSLTHSQGKLLIIAQYVDANDTPVRDTVTININATPDKQRNNLKFVAEKDTIYQGESIETIFVDGKLGNEKSLVFTFDGNESYEQDLVDIVPNGENFKLVSKEVETITDVRTITILATQEEGDNMLGGSVSMQIVVLPRAIWHWSDLYFGTENSNPVTPPRDDMPWNLTLLSCEENLITFDETYKIATVGTPIDQSKVYNATFRFEQEDYRKEFTSEIYADPRMLSYCVDTLRTYKGVTVAASGVTFDDMSNQVRFASTVTNTSSWTIELQGVPDSLLFTPITSSNLWRIEEYNGVYWETRFSFNNIPVGKTFAHSLLPETQQIRITYSSGQDIAGVLQNVCVTALEGVKANTSKVYIPIATDANGSVLPTTQEIMLYSMNQNDLDISLSSNALSVDVTVLPAKTGAYTSQKVTITNVANSEEVVQLYVKDGATTLLTLPIRPFVFRQGLPVNLATNDAERYYFLTTASATDTWNDSIDNVTWDMANKAIVFENPDDVKANRCVVLAYEGAADYIQFHTSNAATLTEWSFQESVDGLSWTPAVDSLKMTINDGKGIRQGLHYTTRYIRISYKTNNLSSVLVTNVQIEGSPHLIANPLSMSLNDDIENQGNIGLLTLTAINLQRIRVESNAPNHFKIIYDEQDYSNQVGTFIATATDYPHALGKNKVGDIQLGIVWQAVNTIDDASITIYNDENDEILAVIDVLGAKGLLTQGNAKTGLYTGIPDGTRDVNEDGVKDEKDKYTYHGKEYKDYKYREVDVKNAFSNDGKALFDYLFIFGETKAINGNNITPPEGKTLIGSNATTSCYVYKKTPNTSGEYVAYQFVGATEMNTSNKATFEDVVVADDSTKVVYIDVQDKLSVYMTGFCPYATTGYDKTQEGVFLFRGKHGSKLDIYLEDCHIISRNKTENGNNFYGNKEGGLHFSDGYARGSGGVLVFENVDPQEQLQKCLPFEVSIHTIGNNLLNSNYGCYFGLNINGSVGMKATQVSSPIHVHMHNKDYARKTKTTLNFDDLWPTTVDENNVVTKTERTNGFLALKKQANNAPSIDMGNKHTEVNFKGGQVELQNSQIGSDTYKTTLAISHRSGYFGADEVGVQLCYGIGTDSVGGTVNFLDGTVTVRPMYVAPAYRQYYLMDVKYDAQGDTARDASGNVVYSDSTSCLRTPMNTYIQGGSICRVRACQHVTSKGGAPKDGEYGELLGQYVYTLQADKDTISTTTKLAHIVGFPANVKDLEKYYEDHKYTYRLNSVTPDKKNQFYFWIPNGYGGVTAEQDKLISTWKACMTEIRAGILDVAEGTIGGDTPIEPNEEVKYFLYCKIDDDIKDVIRAGEKNPVTGEVLDYTYQPPFEVPSAAKDFFNKATYARYDLLQHVSDSLQYQVVSDTAYTITDRVYYITTATADIWQTFTAPFDVANIYIMETYPESELAQVGTRAQILKAQATHNADFAAFFAVAMAMGTYKDFDGIYDSYKAWAYAEDKKSGLYRDDQANYNLRSKQKLVPYVGSNWRDANFYLNENKGNWTLNDETDYFDVNWETLTADSLTKDILLHKGKTYSLMFPYCPNCEEESSLESRTDWDYWSGKFLIFESTAGAQVINGRDFLNDTIAGHIFTQAPGETEVVVTGNSTFARFETNRKNIYVYESSYPIMNNEMFLTPLENAIVQPTTAFLYGYVPNNGKGMPAKAISRTGQIIYDNPNDSGDGTTTGGHIPTVGGGNDLFITETANGINIAVAEPQQVRVMSATGAIIFSGMVQTAVDVLLPTTGVYVVAGENEAHKILY